MKFRYFIFYIILGAFFYSCTRHEKKEEALQDTLKTENPFEKNGIRISEAVPSPEFSNAKIKIQQPQSGEYRKPGKVKFEYKVDDFVLGNQTADAEQKMCANSKQGQHIHFILNNGPYTALYEPKNEVELEEGHYVLLSFLSRSYHESIKTKNAYTSIQFTVGEPQSVDTIITEDYETGELYKTEIAYFGNGKKQQINLPLNSNPYLFYSRPKGTYFGADTQKIMLDFYLLNTELSEDGNKVKVVIDGNEFILTKWVTYFIEGLSMGEHTISLTLIDKDGNPVFWASPFYESGERKIILQEDDPLTAK